MRLSRNLLCIAGLCLAPMSMALAQNFPNKPLRIITGNAGGANDMIARISAQGITANLGQPVIVLNRPGSQFIPVTEAMRAPADGYSLLAVGANQFWLAPFLKDDVPYDPVKDFAPVILTASSPNMIVVHTSVPANNVKELIALAKAYPGKLNYGVGNFGGSPHLAGELFKAMSGTNIQVILYKGTAQAMIAVMAGEMQVLFPTVSSGMVGVKSGKLKALAVTTDKPTALAPGMPTATATGLPGYESGGDYAFFAPIKTPASAIGTLNAAIAKHLQSPDIRQKMASSGLEVVASTPQALAAHIKADQSRMGKVIKEAGIRGEE